MEELGSGVRIGEQCGKKSVVGERKNGVMAEVRYGKERAGRERAAEREQTTTKGV